MATKARDIDREARAREARAQRHMADPDRIEGARDLARTFRRGAEESYRKSLALASRWELYASLMEQGYSVEEANRRAFKHAEELVR